MKNLLSALEQTIHWCIFEHYYTTKVLNQESSLNKLLLLLIIASVSTSQTIKFEVNDFINRTRSKYIQTQLGQEAIQSMVTSSAFINYAKTKTNERIIAPLQIDWSVAGGILVKNSSYNLGTNDFGEERQKLKSVVEGILFTWSAFFVEKQIPDSAMNFNFDHSKDRVFFSYVTTSVKGFMRVSKEFGLNGKLLTIHLQMPSGEEIKLVPQFQELGQKYLCSGWFYQRSGKGGQVLEGMTVKIESTLVNKQFFPANIQLDIQTTQEKYVSYRQYLHFTDYLLNGVPVE
jgi:hypothetical protein